MHAEPVEPAEPIFASLSDCTPIKAAKWSNDPAGYQPVKLSSLELNRSGRCLHTPITKGVHGGGVVLLAASAPTRIDGSGNNDSKMTLQGQAAFLDLAQTQAFNPYVAIIDFSTASYEYKEGGGIYDGWCLTERPPATAVSKMYSYATDHLSVLFESGVLTEGVQVIIVPCAKWVHRGGPLRPGVESLAKQLLDLGFSTRILSDTKYPKRIDNGAEFADDLKKVVGEEHLMLNALQLSELGTSTDATMSARRAIAHRISSAGGKVGGKAGGVCKTSQAQKDAVAASNKKRRLPDTAARVADRERCRLYKIQKKASSKKAA